MRAWGACAALLALLSAEWSAGEDRNVIIVDGPVPPQPPMIAYDFVTQFDQRNVANAQAVSASLSEKSGEVALPGIFLHPPSAGDALLRYPGVVVPTGRYVGIKAFPVNAKRDSIPFLVFRIGMRDGIPWGAADNTPNGVRFTVLVDGTEAFREDVVGPGWRARAVDLSPWFWKSVAIEFRTNAIDGRPNYDWAAFGRPLLMNFSIAGALDTLPADANGVVVARVDCATPAVVRLAVGNACEEARLDKGTHWVPVEFDTPKPPALTVVEGEATLGPAYAQAFQPDLTEREFDLSTPLLIAGEPFSALLKAKNTGLGKYVADGKTGNRLRSLV